MGIGDSGDPARVGRPSAGRTSANPDWQIRPVDWGDTGLGYLLVDG